MGLFSRSNEKKLKAQLDQAVTTCFFNMLLADNGEKLYSRMKVWNEKGEIFEMIGDDIDPGNKLVMEVNKMILDSFGDQSFETLSNRYKEALLKMGLAKDW